MISKYIKVDISAKTCRISSLWDQIEVCSCSQELSTFPAYCSAQDKSPDSISSQLVSFLGFLPNSIILNETDHTHTVTVEVMMIEWARTHISISGIFIVDIGLVQIQIQILLLYCLQKICKLFKILKSQYWNCLTVFKQK